MNREVFLSFVKEATALNITQHEDKALSPKETREVITQLTHRNKLEKKASLGVNAMELGGLGVLSVPGFKTLRNPNASAEEKSHAKWENAGLGVLAAHPAYETANTLSGGRIGNTVSRGISKFRSSNLMRAL